MVINFIEGRLVIDLYEVIVLFLKRKSRFINNETAVLPVSSWPPTKEDGASNQLKGKAKWS